MKNISILFLSLTLTINSFAQNTADLSTRIIFPNIDTGYEVPYNDTFRILMSIKNNGPDNVLPTDTIGYQIGGFPVVNLVMDTIDVGDSIIINPWTIINVHHDTDLIWHACIFLNYTAYHFINDMNQLNDTSCLSFILKGGNNNSIGLIDKQTGTEMPIDIYPNPASNIIYLNFKKPVSGDTVKIEIFDLIGRMQLRKVLVLSGRRDGVPLNISSLKPGIYIQRMYLNNDVFTTKLIVK